MAKIKTLNKFKEMILLHNLSTEQDKRVKEFYGNKGAVYLLVNDVTINKLDKLVDDIGTTFPTVQKIYLASGDLPVPIRDKYNGNGRYAERKVAIQLLEFEHKSNDIFETQILFTN